MGVDADTREPFYGDNKEDKSFALSGIFETIVWIPVEDRLPELSINKQISRTVLLYSKGEVFNGYLMQPLNTDDPVWVRSFLDMPSGVTHWAELPKGPKI